MPLGSSCDGLTIFQKKEGANHEPWTMSHAWKCPRPVAGRPLIDGGGCTSALSTQSTVTLGSSSSVSVLKSKKYHSQHLWWSVVLKLSPIYPFQKQWRQGWLCMGQQLIWSWMSWGEAAVGSFFFFFCFNFTSKLREIFSYSPKLKLKKMVDIKVNPNNILLDMHAKVVDLN